MNSPGINLPPLSFVTLTLVSTWKRLYIMIGRQIGMMFCFIEAGRVPGDIAIYGWYECFMNF